MAGMAVANRELAHLTLHPARIAPATTGDHALLQNLLEHALMKAFSLLRGE